MLKHCGATQQQATLSIRLIRLSTTIRQKERGGCLLCHLGRCLQEGSIGGIETYFAEPSSPPKGGIMLLQDIHGWKTKNIRLVADKYADAGMHLACSCTYRSSPMHKRILNIPMHTALDSI